MTHCPGSIKCSCSCVHFQAFVAFAFASSVGSCITSPLWLSFHQALCGSLFSSSPCGFCFWKPCGLLHCKTPVALFPSSLCGCWFASLLVCIALQALSGFVPSSPGGCCFASLLVCIALQALSGFVPSRPCACCFASLLGCSIASP